MSKKKIVKKTGKLLTRSKVNVIIIECVNIRG